MDLPELYVPHAGWLRHEPGDEVARFLSEGWFEYKEQAFFWLYLRPGDTFLDGGAHIGLYSVVAGRAMNDSGTIVAVEPHPVTATLLDANLRANGVTCAILRPSALFSRSGPVTLHAGGPGKSAYSSVSSVDGSQDAFTVEAVTLDEMLNGQVQLAKLDLEGAELEALAGAAGSIERGLLPLLVVECTEANLARCGAGTESLFTALRNHGYTVCRFDAGTCRLVVRDYAGPIGYDNLFAAQNLEDVNLRLAAAAESSRRIALDILNRGSAAERLFLLSDRLEQRERLRQAAERRAAEAAESADTAFRNLGEANWRAEQAGKRAELAERRAAEARSAVQESERRTEEASKRAEEAAQATEAAYRRVGEANWRADQAEARAAAAEKRAQEARRHSDDLLRSAEAALERLGAADQQAAESENRAHQSRDAALQHAAHAAEMRLRLNELLASRYLRAGWKLGFARKPAWVDAPEIKPRD